MCSSLRRLCGSCSSKQALWVSPVSADGQSSSVRNLFKVCLVHTGCYLAGVLRLNWHAVNVYLPKDRVTSQHQGYGFVEFKSEEDADYVSLGASPAK